MVGNLEIGGQRPRFARARFLFAILLCVPLIVAMGSGPKAPITSEEFVGSYVSTHRLADETLEISADGTYHHVYEPHEGEGFEQSGTWDLVGVYSEFSAFTLYDYTMPPYPWSAFESNHVKKEGIEWACHANRSFATNTLHLQISPDSGYHFIKQD